MNKKNKVSKSPENKFSFTSTLSKKERSVKAKYLTKRITELYSILTEWIDGLGKYSVKKISVNIEGEKLPALEILSGKKIVCSLKLVSLFAFGFNCRVDIISGKTIHSIVDIAKENSDPDWQLISSSAGKKPKKLTKMIFRNLVKGL